MDRFIELIELIKKENPHLRYGQIIYLAMCKAEWKNGDCFYIPDDKLCAGLAKELQDLRDEAVKHQGR